MRWQTEAIEWVARQNEQGHTPAAAEVVAAVGGCPSLAEKRTRHRCVTHLIGEGALDQIPTPHAEGGYGLVAVRAGRHGHPRKRYEPHR